MAIRNLVNITDKASLVPGVVGNALTLEQSNTAYPEGGNKRFQMNLNAQSVGNTPVELFVDGINAFRIRPTADSVMLVKLYVMYYSAVTASSVAFDVTVASTNFSNVIALLGAALAVKYGASAATCVVTASTNGLVITGTGVAGDTNGRWEARALINEVTDLG